MLKTRFPVIRAAVDSLVDENRVVELTVPMIVFNIPVLFAIILGPAIIQVMAMP